jgi:GMP synthase (glutamine-hydrolysing)
VPGKQADEVSANDNQQEITQRITVMVNTEKFINQSIAEIKTLAGEEKVVMALSGGVDSSVCAALAARAIGDRLVPIYIDTGLMRKGETERISTIFGNIQLQIVDAGDEFLDALRGITDPEAKRMAIGERFIRVFEREARKVGAKCLLQGTIYPDRIESEGGIKSHHNVGGMPLHMEFTKVIEPIRDLYKDEVREVAGALHLPKEIQHRMPFPGPGLAVRVLGEVTREKVAIIREANWIVEDELVEKYVPWQCFAALLGLGTGVKGDNRIHGWIVAIRAVNSRDGMTADPLDIPFEHLMRIGSRITADIPSVSRVVYDITAKPPATIEYE